MCPLQGQSSLKTAELGTILSRVASARERAARETPQYWQHREEAARQLEHRLQQADQRRRDSEPAAGGTMRTKARNAAAAAAQGIRWLSLTVIADTPQS